MRKAEHDSRATVCLPTTSQSKLAALLPRTEEILVQFLSGYLVDIANEDEDILQVARYILESIAMDKQDVLEMLMAALSTILQNQLTHREKDQSGPKL